MIRELDWVDVRLSDDKGGVMSVNAANDEAVLIVVNKEATSTDDTFVFAAAGPEAELMPYSRKYADNQKYITVFKPAPDSRHEKNEEPVPAYTSGSKAAWEEVSGDVGAKIREAVAQNYIDNPHTYIDLSQMLGVDGLKQKAQIIYSFLFCKDRIVSSELNVYNRAPRLFNPDLVFPADLFSLCLGNGRAIVPFKAFWKELRRQSTVAEAVADYERENGEITRITITLDCSGGFILHIVNAPMVPLGDDPELLSIRLCGNGQDDIPEAEISEISAAVCAQLKSAWTEHFPAQS